MRFYSGKGDNGTSALFGSGKRLPKNAAVFELLGSLDELNSYLGVCRSLSKDKNINGSLSGVQENLFILQAMAGGAKNIALGRDKLKKLEKETDKYGGKIGIITKFVIPGENLLSAHLDYARTLARRAERAYLAVGRPSGDNVSLAYLNRLSSLLYVMARYTGKKNGEKEKNPSYK